MLSWPLTHEQLLGNVLDYYDRFGLGCWGCSALDFMWIIEVSVKDWQGGGADCCRTFISLIGEGLSLKLKSFSCQRDVSALSVEGGAGAG